MKLGHLGAEFNVIFFTGNGLLGDPEVGLQYPAHQKAASEASVFREQVCLEKHHSWKKLPLLSVISLWLHVFPNNSHI